MTVLIVKPVLPTVWNVFLLPLVRYVTKVSSLLMTNVPNVMSPNALFATDMEYQEKKSRDV